MPAPQISEDMVKLVVAASVALGGAIVGALTAITKRTMRPIEREIVPKERWVSGELHPVESLPLLYQQVADIRSKLEDLPRLIRDCERQMSDKISVVEDRVGELDKGHEVLKEKLSGHIEVASERFKKIEEWLTERKSRR